jgi:hypothetical protein
VPPLSNAFRYSSATDFRCSSVIGCLEIAISSSLARLTPTPPAVQVSQTARVRA